MKLFDTASYLPPGDVYINFGAALSQDNYVKQDLDRFFKTFYASINILCLFLFNTELLLQECILYFVPCILYLVQMGAWNNEDWFFCVMMRTSFVRQ